MDYTLVINRTETRCGACRKNADRFEDKHETVLDPFGFPKFRPGCGQRFVFVDTDYWSGDGSWERHVQEERPDLAWARDCT